MHVCSSLTLFPSTLLPAFQTPRVTGGGARLALPGFQEALHVHGPSLTPSNLAVPVGSETQAVSFCREYGGVGRRAWRGAKPTSL